MCVISWIVSSFVEYVSEIINLSTNRLVICLF